MLKIDDIFFAHGKLTANIYLGMGFHGDSHAAKTSMLKGYPTKPH